MAQTTEQMVVAAIPDMDIILKYFSAFSQEQLGQLQKLEALYREWNGKINVISRKDIDGLYEKHVLHSLSIAAAFEFQPGSSVIDIGTGGGFPGIPLAIFYPEVRFHLVDSIAKKLKVVEAVAEGIGLQNITTQHTRAEEIRGKKFDFAVSRAVAPLAELWKWAKPLLRGDKVQVDREQGYKGQGPGLICLKGGDLAAEIHESRTRPRMIEVSEIFPEDYFKEKYLLYVPR